MSYLIMSQMAQDAALFQRCKLCAVQQGVPSAEAEQWTDDHRLIFAIAPGWHLAWESAVAAGIENPGAHPGVISDGMILAETQIHVAGEGLSEDDAHEMRVAAWHAAIRPATMQCENPPTNDAQDTL